MGSLSSYGLPSAGMCSALDFDRLGAVAIGRYVDTRWIYCAIVSSLAGRPGGITYPPTSSVFLSLSKSWLFIFFNVTMYYSFVAVICVFFVYSGLVSALPPPDLALRQVASVTVPTALSSPTSVTTTSTVQTANGTMIETCVLTFTPVGQQIQEVSNCTMTAASASSSASPGPAAVVAFVMPGTSIQVLPVGLVVFGGITALAVFFVAFVTWERVRYRKSFRQQRMVENNSFGYGRVTKG